MKAHFQDVHKSAPISTNENLWKLSNFETAEMKKIWAKRKHIVMKRTKKSTMPPLVVSESHRAHIPTRYCVLSLYRKGGNDSLPYRSHADSSDLDSDQERISDENTDNPGDEESGYGGRMVDAREEPREVEISPDSPTTNAEVSRPHQVPEDVDMAPPACVDEAIFDITECQNSNSVSFLS